MARRVAVLVGVLVLIASGTYLLVYLYRWEWNRALIAGVFFVAAEVGLLGAAVLERLAGLHARLDRVEAADRARVRSHVRDARAEAPSFSWLAPDPDRLSVFVPVLLGAGVILSGLAWLVDRLARLTAQPGLEHRLIARLDPITYRSGDLTNATGLMEVDSGLPPRDGRWRPLLAAGVAALIVWGGLDALADATQSRPDSTVVADHTLVVARIATRGSSRTPVPLAEALWTTCRSMVPQRAAASTFVRLDERTVSFRIHPPLGENASERLRGCLEDATIDRVQAGVVTLEAMTDPAEG